MAKQEMTAAMRKAMGLASLVRVKYEPTVNGRLPLWLGQSEH